ncbi:MAG: beta-ribofuranosylaminobenzene 5'-phosphate synthase family protein [Chloroflexota bacterium]
MSTVRIDAPARLHLGMFDVSGTLGRRFGGIGVAIEHPRIVVQASPASRLTAEGPGAERALDFAQRYLEARQIRDGAHLCIEANVPGHVGLGSGTRMGLTVAWALATLYDQPIDPPSMALDVGRGSRSVIGLWSFAQGGLILEGGQWPGRDTLAPLLMRYDMPPSWRCVLAIPCEVSGLSGEKEKRAFRELAPSRSQAAAIAHVTLMSLLPALVEGDLAEFGPALTELQRLVGEMFSPVQGGRFAHTRSAQLIEAMLEWGAAGAGQSSWGPAVYGLVEGDERAQALKDHLHALMGDAIAVYAVAFDNQGVLVQRR